jgi:polyhydroxyalkanoate synthesis repressor PhaR
MLIISQCGIKSQSSFVETYFIVSNEANALSEPVVIKKYANRRLYNTETSSYVTLEDLAEMVRAERDFLVHDAKTGEELTHAVLTQIIVEQESKGQNLLPVGFLRQLIRFYGDSIEQLVPSYLEFSLDSLTRDQDRYREKFAGAFGESSMEAMREQAKQNSAMFEQALGMFTPYSAMGMNDTENREAMSKNDNTPEAGCGARSSKEKTSEIETLKAELTAMQDKLDQISKRTP